jgi:calpain-7
MNVTIYEKHPTELFGAELATSGPYTNVIQGVATGEVVLSQNEMGKVVDFFVSHTKSSSFFLSFAGYIIVLATHDKDVAAEFTAIVYSDRPVSIKNDR